MTNTITVEDLTPAFLDYWQQAESREPAERIALWHQVYEAAHPDMLALYFRRWGKPEQLAAAVERFAEIVPQLLPTVSGIRRALASVSPQVCALFDTPDPIPPFVLLVGLFASDAWATRFRGQPTCFLSLENFVERQAHLEISLAHESAHGFHARVSDLNLETTSIAEGLLMEGLAVLATRRLYPNVPEDALFWPDVSHTTDGQTTSDWLAECRARWPELRELVLRDFAHDDEAGFASYFWTRKATRQAGVPVCAGYFVGYRLLQELNRKHPLGEIVTWPVARCIYAMHEVLEDTPPPPMIWQQEPLRDC